MKFWNVEDGRQLGDAPAQIAELLMELQEVAPGDGNFLKILRIGKALPDNYARSR